MTEIWPDARAPEAPAGPGGRAVVLLQLGGPDSLAAIEPFLANLLGDPYTVPLPWWLAPFQARLALFVARRRSAKVAELYKLIGGRSPILDHTRAQARALEAELAARGQPAAVHVAMRCWHPLTEETVDVLVAADAKDVVLLPLYPQESRATTTSAVARFEEVALDRIAAFHPAKVAGPYPAEPGYIAATCATVRDALAKFAAPDRVTILFSAHSLPHAMVLGGDPYPAQIAVTRKAVEAALGLPNPTALGFQSQLGPVKWLGPSTHDEILRLAAAGCRELLLVPLGFVSEHLETLYEMDLLYGDQARALGMRFARAPALGTHPEFVRALADVVLRVFEAR
jgi:ferrochelatase